MPQARRELAPLARNSQSFKSEKAIDEIGKWARILRHESVATTRELGQPRARNGVNQLQRIRRRNYDVLTASGDLYWPSYLRQPIPNTIVMPCIHGRSLTVDQLRR